MSDPKSLTEAFSSYPADHPQTLKDLVAADPDKLSHPLAWLLRKQTVEATRAAERHFVNGPNDAMRLLRNNYVLHPWTDAWTSYALNPDRQVVLVPHDKGGMVPMRKATRLIPHAEDLPDLPFDRRGARKPAWLVLYGGTPEVLSRKGVAKGLATLQRRVPVADILFYHRDKETRQPPTLWSARAGCGMTEGGGHGGAAIPFPDTTALEEVRRTP